MKKKLERNYLVHAGGRLWTVDGVSLTLLPDDTLGVSQAELEKVHRGVANAICAGHEVLSIEELDFLCDVTTTTYAEVAAFLDLNKSTISTWRRKGAVPTRLTSNALKKWFWFRLFGDALSDERLPLSNFQDDAAFLETATQRAIKAKATLGVELGKAS